MEKDKKQTNQRQPEVADCAAAEGAPEDFPLLLPDTLRTAGSEFQMSMDIRTRLFSRVLSTVRALRQSKK